MSEAENVEGEGLVYAVIGAIGYCCQETVRIIVKGITEATVSGAVTGAIVGAYSSPI